MLPSWKAFCFPPPHPPPGNSKLKVVFSIMVGLVIFLKPKEVLGKAVLYHLYLFIFAAEVMAKAIRNNTNIKGISVKVKISQYADDTTLILDRSLKSLSYSLDLLDDFGKVSGLKLNDRKTEALWIGSCIGNDQTTLPSKNFKWPKATVKALGLWISTDSDMSTSLNYNEKLKNVHLIPEDYTTSISTALGLRQDTSKFTLQVNYCLLLARYHIWLAKTKAIHPTFIRYLHLLKSRYELETQSGDTRKWEPLVGHL